MADTEPRGHGRWERHQVRRDLTDPRVLADVCGDQISCSRARARWYDDVYMFSGDDDRGPELNGAWLSELSEVEARWQRPHSSAAASNLGAGTGYWTERIALSELRATFDDAGFTVAAGGGVGRLGRRDVATDSVREVADAVDPLGAVVGVEALDLQQL